MSIRTKKLWNLRLKRAIVFLFCTNIQNALHSIAQSMKYRQNYPYCILLAEKFPTVQCEVRAKIV